MRKLTKDEQIKLDALTAEYEQAKVLARGIGATPEERQASVTVGAELSAFVMAMGGPKVRCCASRAGMRQAAERRAMHAGRRG